MIGRRLSHYQILSELGRGGMGIVYKAQDEKLPRFIALKVLRAEYAQNPENRRRFLREARAAAVVEHPYIATIYEADEDDAMLFIAMEYVDGLTLGAILAKGPLSIRDALHHGVEIAEGLAKAHKAHVIHRDLKPDNIMISTEGHAKILDFGLAKLLETSDPKKSSIQGNAPTASFELTERYARLGTPAYMSPEQVRASEVDHRSDLFSFGVTLREMFTRRSVFRRPSQADTLAAILRDNPAPLAVDNPELPQELEWILEKCLAKDPRDRYQDTRDLVVDLENLRWKWESGSGSGARAARRASSPVTPSSREAVGLATSTSTSLPTKPKVPLSRWIGYTLVLAFIIVGAVRMSDHRKNQDGDQVFYKRGLHYLREESESPSSITNAIQMFHRAVVADSNSVRAWAALSETYWMHFARTRSLASQEEAETALARAIALDPTRPETLNAMGRGYLAHKRYAEAEAVLQRAITKDAKLDAAWANLGNAHRGLRNYAEGLEAIQTAIRLRPDSFRHRISFGNFYRAFGEFESAASSYRQAIDLKPNSMIAWNNLGSVLLVSSPKEAAKAFRQALETDNKFADAWSNLGTAYYFSQDYEAAEESYRHALALEPKRVVHYTNLADALVMLEREEECRDIYSLASELALLEAMSKPKDASARIRLGVLCARAGDEPCALDATQRAEALQPGNAQILFLSAKIYCILHKPQLALDRLDSAVKFGLKKAEIKNDPDLRALHDRSRYERILELAG